MKLLKVALIFSLVFLFSVNEASAIDELKRGKKVGEKAEGISGFSNIAGDNGLILMFNRSVGWCPFCQKQVIDWNKEIDKFSAKGYVVAVVTYDAPEVIAKFKNQHEIKLPIIADEKSELIKAFDVLNYEDFLAKSKFFGVPHPIIYVIDSEKNITARFSREGYKNRPSIEEVLSAL